MGRGITGGFTRIWLGADIVTGLVVADRMSASRDPEAADGE
jgi:hypothetical protein